VRSNEAEDGAYLLGTTDDNENGAARATRQVIVAGGRRHVAHASGQHELTGEGGVEVELQREHSQVDPCW
jgi:hypothetical protein